MRVHINGALNVGAPPEKIVEVFLQCVPCAGVPGVMNGVFAAREVFAGRGLSRGAGRPAEAEEA